MRKTRIKANKRLHITLIITVFVLMIPMTRVRCNAQESIEDKVTDIIDDLNDILPNEVSDAESYSAAVDIRSILSSVFNTIKGQGGELSAFLLMLVGVALIGALASQARGGSAALASRAVYTVASALLLDRLSFLVVGVSKSLEEVGKFFGAVIPISVAVNSLGVSPSTASTQALGMGVTLSVYSFIGTELISSIAGAIFVLAAASAIDPLFSRLAKCVKNIFLTLLGILTALIGATFSLQSTLSASADSALLRSAKYAVSSTVPIVGGAVSGALGIVSGAVSYARGVVGGGAIAALILLMLSPLVTLFAYRLCLKAGILVASLSSIDGCEGVLAPFLGALDALLGVYFLTCILYVTELAAFMKGGASFV